MLSQLQHYICGICNKLHLLQFEIHWPHKTPTEKKRIAEHIADINHNRTNVSDTARHFIDKHDMSLKYFTFHAIERVDKPVSESNWVKMLHNREAYWILMLQSRYPTGLNYNSDLLYIY